MVVEEHEAVARIGVIAEKRGASDGERAGAYTATARQTADGVDHIQVKSVVRLQNYSVSVPGRGCRSIKSFGRDMTGLGGASSARKLSLIPVAGGILTCV